VPPFVLIGRRTLRSNNSWMNGIERLNRGPDRCTLLMHPDDAATIGAESGTTVRVATAGAGITAPLRIDPEIMRGVVSLPHGFARANINELTGGPLDDATGNAAFSGIPCSVVVTEAVPTA
jgi:anaerobic selenocysteine-containing dehydrogenase